MHRYRFTGGFMRCLCCFFLILSWAYAAPVIYVGKVASTDALIALVIEGDTVLGYSCGGNGNWSTHSSWFPQNDQSVIGQGSFELVGAAGHRLQGLYTETQAEGFLTLPDGTQLSWSATPVAEDSPAGLYLLNEKSAESEDLIGLIVHHDLQSVGNIRHIAGGRSALFQPVGLAQALPVGSAESLTVCFTLESVSCKSLPRATQASL